MNLTPPLKTFPLEFVTALGCKKTRAIMEKFDDMCIRLDIIPEQMDND